MSWTLAHTLAWPYLAAEDGSRDGLAFVEDHAAEGEALLLQQFADSAKLKALLGCYLDQVELLERALWDLLTMRDLESATGAQLDGLGAIAGERRAGRLDPEYRAAIRVYLWILRSHGTLPEILSILSTIATGADTTGNVAAIELWPASLRCEVLPVWPISLDASRRLLGLMRPAGVRMDVLILASSDDAITFGSSFTEADPNGFADSGLTVGGLASGVIRA